MSIKCEDHLGNKFHTVKEMCCYWNVYQGTFKSRQDKGWSLEDSLCGKEKTKIYDHKGNVYKSVSDMCKEWGIAENTYNSRRRMKWSLADALTKEVSHHNKSGLVEDHLGNKFVSDIEMADYYGIHVSTFETRRKLGWSVEKALTTSVKSKKGNIITDHEGNEYDSLVELYKKYNIYSTRYYKGIKEGLDLEEILTGCTHYGVEDFDGNTFRTVKEMCDFYGISTDLYYNRKKRGLSEKEALTQKKGIRVKAVDPNGKVFDSVLEMLEGWGVNRNTYYYKKNKGYTTDDILLNN